MTHCIGSFQNSIIHALLRISYNRYTQPNSQMNSGVDPSDPVPLGRLMYVLSFLSVVK